MKANPSIQVQRAIVAVDGVRNPTDYYGIDFVRGVLIRMQTALESGTIPDYRIWKVDLGRMVTDMWPIPDDVANAVRDAERAFAQLSKDLHG